MSDTNDKPEKPRSKKRLPVLSWDKENLEKLKSMKPAVPAEEPTIPGQKLIPGRMTLVCHFAAVGLRPKEIAASIEGMTVDEVRDHLQVEAVQKEIRALQHQYFGGDPMRRFKAMVNDAADILEDAMKDKHVKTSVRVQAADKILDRALGKPKQFLSVEGNLIRRVYETLDGKKVDEVAIEPGNPNVRDVEAVTVQKAAEVASATVATPTEPDPSRHVDDWVNSFLK